MTDPYGSLERCGEFIDALPISVRPRAALFFGQLDRRGELGSVEVAQLLRCERKVIGPKLTKWIRGAAKDRGWELPYDGGRGEEAFGGITNPRVDQVPEETYYVDRNGNAARLAAAADGS